MKIGVFPADTSGCGHYRLIWPAFALQDKGLSVEVVPPNKRDGMFTGVVENGKLLDVRIPDFDVMVFQRVTHRYLAQAIRIIREKGVAVVVDIDDDLEAIHPKNPAWNLLHPNNYANEQVAQHSWRWARLACESATFVTVSSDALLRRYAPHGRGVVIRNYVPEEFLTVPHESSAIVGWGGSLHSHPDDVPMLGTSIATLQREGIEFRVIGPGTGVRQALSLETEPRATGSVEMESWPAALAQLGVGVAPLAYRTRFNAAKSWLKPLEYASVGVVPVMSPGVEYRKIQKMGVGVLADKSRDWVNTIRRFVRNETLREDTALQVRALVAEKLTVQQNAYRWEEAWTNACDLEEHIRPEPNITPGSALGIAR